MKGFLIALQFLTRIPVTVKGDIEEEDLLQSVYFYPLIGLIIGIILFLIYGAVTGVLPPGVRPVIVLAALVLLSGGLHLDGFMDTMDALGSGAEKGKALEIMRDSRVGAFGVLGVVVLLLIKFNFLQNISPGVLPEVLLVMPVFSRLAAVISMPLADYAREGYGLGKVLVDQVSWKEVLVTTVFSLVVGVIIMGMKVFSIFLIVVIFLWLWNHYLKKRIGGITGDTLGAVIEMAEVLILALMLF